MGLDIKKLREMQKDLKKKSGQGDGLLLYANKLPEELDIRILPPKSNMNGTYFLCQEGWWINGKFFLIDPDTDVIGEELEEAKNSGDKTLVALVEKKKNGMPIIKKESRYALPILVLKVDYDEDEGKIVSCQVEDTKVLIAKPQLMTEINKVVTSRPFQNGTEWGIADRVLGHNLIIGKTGKGLNTEYTAMGWNEPMEMDEKYYEDKEVPDILGMYNKSLKSDEYLRSVIRNYLYGEDIIEDDSDEEEEDEAVERKSKPARKSTPQRRPSRKVKEEEVEEEFDDEEEEVEEEAPKPSRPKSRTVKSNSPKATAKKPAKGRSLLEDAADDLSDLD